jgi:hypothetical protein
MNQATTDEAGRRRQWALLLLAVVGVALVVGVPLGFVAALQTGAWLEWMLWAVPVAMGLVTFWIGVHFLMWNASAVTKRKTLATAIVWGLVYAALMLVDKPLWFAAKGLLSWTVAVAALFFTLRIWNTGSPGVPSTE